MRETSEKRDFIRMQLGSEIELAYRDDPARKITGRCEDLSATGMSVVVGEAIAEGTELETFLASHNPDFPPFETYARVVRCTEVRAGEVLLGLEIVEVRR